LTRAALTIASVALLVLWGAWWVESVRRDRLKHARATWVPALPFLAGDFKVHIDHVARVYATGVNPYRINLSDDPTCARFPYPPMVPRVFAWVSLVSTPTAVKVWLGALAGCLAVGAVAARRTRRSLGLTPVPLAALAVVLAYSTPALFAMERGQSDPMVVPALAAAAWLLGRRSAGAEVAAGILLGATAWLKYYPGLAVLGLIPLRRWRGLAAALAVGLLVGVVDRPEVLQAIANGRYQARVAEHPLGHIPAMAHSLVSNWRSFWLVRRVYPLSAVPGAVAAAALLLPAAAVVGTGVARARDPRVLALAFPLFAWLTAAATYAMPYSNDYNLVPLPVAALAVWDRRDRVWVHMAMGLLVLWWQPLMLTAGGGLLLIAKTAGLLAVGASLRARARAVSLETAFASMGKPVACASSATCSGSTRREVTVRSESWQGGVSGSAGLSCWLPWGWPTRGARTRRSSPSRSSR
jgi:hypothetical protein